MKRFNHNPGPWRYTIHGPHPDNMAALDIKINRGEDSECVAGSVYEEADARLIAACPEMLDALIYLLRVADPYRTGGMQHQREAISMSLAAIEKATGMTIDDALAAYAESQK